jgi:GNAT superfamily N-acetyltransferase
MNDIKIREIRPEDLPQLEELLATRPELNAEGAKKRAQLMDWIAFHNPNSGQDATYFVAEHNGKIIGFHGRMPTKFNFEGVLKNGYFIHDLYVHPTYREKGMGFWLTVAFAKEIENTSKYFFILVWMTGFNLQLQRRRKYFELEDRIETFKKVLKSKVYLEHFLRSKLLANITSPVVDLILQFLDLKLWFLPEEKLQKVTRFDGRFDELMQRVAPKIGITSVRNSEVLNWRYIDRPFPRDTILARSQNDQIKGFVVLCENPRYKGQGEILDLVADPNDTETVTILIKGAIRHFKQMGFHTVSCFMSNKRYSKQLTNCLFIKRKEKKVVLLGNCEQEDLSVMKELQNWHFTKSESDGFMLNF